MKSVKLIISLLLVFAMSFSFMLPSASAERFANVNFWDYMDGTVFNDFLKGVCDGFDRYKDDEKDTAYQNYVGSLPGGGFGRDGDGGRYFIWRPTCKARCCYAGSCVDLSLPSSFSFTDNSDHSGSVNTGIGNWLDWVYAPCSGRYVPVVCFSNSWGATATYYTTVQTLSSGDTVNSNVSSLASCSAYTVHGDFSFYADAYFRIYPTDTTVTYF